MSKRMLIGLGILALVIVAAGAFFAGMKVGEARASQAQRQFVQGRFGVQAPQPGQGVARQGSGTMGTIEAVEDGALTLNTQQGSVQVKTTDTTLIQKNMTVGVEDLKAGDQVMVMGSKNDDGSITARSIQTVRLPQAPQAVDSGGQ